MNSDELVLLDINTPTPGMKRNNVLLLDIAYNVDQGKFNYNSAFMWERIKSLQLWYWDSPILKVRSPEENKIIEDIISRPSEQISDIYLPLNFNQRFTEIKDDPYLLLTVEEIRRPIWPICRRRGISFSGRMV
jgi:hypothetical protein